MRDFKLGRTQPDVCLGKFILTLSDGLLEQEGSWRAEGVMG